ncbi:MAG: molybdenum cofactor biosynthesis protein MoaE [Desulforhopalus sp.]|nr:molybdenum cofactor biosynthesis protein MoaE [Desulforhopalus sp.]
MDINKELAELKKRPDFADNVGMILIHNGVVRNWSRGDHTPVKTLEVTPDQEMVEAFRQEYLAKPGIWEILVEAKSGTFHPGDDLLYIIVAGDIRENVKTVLAEILDKIKGEAIGKKEILA